MSKREESWELRRNRSAQFGDYGTPCFAAWTGPKRNWEMHKSHCADCRAFQAEYDRKHPPKPPPPVRTGWIDLQGYGRKGER